MKAYKFEVYISLDTDEIRAAESENDETFAVQLHFTNKAFKELWNEELTVQKNLEKLTAGALK